MVKSLRVADRGVDGEGQDDWISPALPPLAMIKQVIYIHLWDCSLQLSQHRVRTAFALQYQTQMHVPRLYYSIKPKQRIVVYIELFLHYSTIYKRPNTTRHLQVQKKLPDEDKQLVQNNMLVGIAPELIGNTPEEMRAISSGKGDQFVVQGVLRSGKGGDIFCCCHIMARGFFLVLKKKRKGKSWGVDTI